MKEAFGGTWLFQIVILFILLFTGIMCLTINHSKAFAVKSDIVNYIEAKDGIALRAAKVDDGIIDIIKKDGYYTTAKCPDGYKGVARDGKISSSGSDSIICIKNITTGQEAGGCYYDVIVFYRLDLPIIGSAFNFKVNGKTKALYEKCNK